MFSIVSGIAALGGLGYWLLANNTISSAGYLDDELAIDTEPITADIEDMGVLKN